jgi:hypothetical protein
MSGIQRIRHAPDTVLDQVEAREQVWNPDTLQYEPYTGVVSAELASMQFECIAFPDDTTWTYTLDALGEVNTAETDGMATLGIGISGTWDGTLTFEMTMNGTDYYPIPVLNVSTGAIGTTTTINGIFVTPCAGLYRIRVRASVWNSGAASVRLRASIAPLGLYLTI